jgi:hypothetical protein
MGVPRSSKDAALDGDGFGQGRHDGSVGAVVHVVASEDGQVPQLVLVGAGLVRLPNFLWRLDFWSLVRRDRLGSAGSGRCR